MSEIKNTTVVKEGMQAESIKDFTIALFDNPKNPAIVDFKDISTQAGKLKHDTLTSYIEAGNDALIINKLPKHAYNGINKITLGLLTKSGEAIALKTAGVYITRVNKILSGNNPNSGTRGKSVKSEFYNQFALLQEGNNIKILHIESGNQAIVSNNGNVTTNDYLKFAHVINDLLSARPHDNTFKHYDAYIADNNNNLTKCEPQYLALSYNGINAGIAGNADNLQAITDARGILMTRLLSEGIAFDSQTILDLKPELVGADTWLNEEFVANWHIGLNKYNPRQLPK